MLHSWNIIICLFVVFFFFRKNSYRIFGWFKRAILSQNVHYSLRSAKDKTILLNRHFILIWLIYLIWLRWVEFEECLTVYLNGLWFFAKEFHAKKTHAEQKYDIKVPSFLNIHLFAKIFFRSFSVHSLLYVVCNLLGLYLAFSHFHI